MSMKDEDRTSGRGRSGSYRERFGKIPGFFHDSRKELKLLEEDSDDDEKETLEWKEGKERGESKKMRRKLSKLQRQGTVFLLDMMTKAEPTFEERFQPILTRLFAILSYLCTSLYDFYKTCEKQELLCIFSLLYGAFCLLFGVHFRMVITFVEAIRYTSFSLCEEALNDLLAQGSQVHQQYEKEKKDRNEDEKTTFFEKLLLLLRTIEPQVVGNAMAILYASALAVLACLRVKIAQNFALGLSIGDVISKAAIQELPPMLMVLVNEPYHQWIEPFLLLSCRIVSCWIAFFLSRYLSLIHSVLRGSQMIVRGVIVYFHGQEVADELEGSIPFLVPQFFLILFGISFQLRLMKSYPLLLRLLLSPFSILDSLLALTVGTFDIFLADQSMVLSEMGM